MPQCRGSRPVDYVGREYLSRAGKSGVFKVNGMRKKWMVLLLISGFITLGFLNVGCGKSGQSENGRAANPAAQPGSKPAPGNKRAGGGSGRPGAMSGTPAPPVSVGSVQRAALNSYLVLNGIVEPERKVEIFSRLSAYVQRIVQEEGAYVRENDVLAQLDDTEIRISYEQARITREQSKLSLDEAEKNYLRSKELIARELLSEQEYQTQEAEFKQRQLDFKNAEESYKNLQLQLNWTKIRSLSEGYITERLIEVGDRVNANEQVYTIEDFKPLLIRVFVPASDSIKLNTEMTAEVTTEVIPGAVFDGNVKLINPRIDVETGTVKVTVEVYDDTLRLKPGMFVESRIVLGKKEDVLVIPRRALLYKQNRIYVFVLDGETVSQREVTLGLTEEDHVEILTGLEEGDTIVEVGVEGIKDGQVVDVVQ